MATLRDGQYRAWVRRYLVRSQGGKCCYCKRSFTKGGPTQMTIEHKKARMDGGSDDLSNLAAACLHCNQHRGQQKNRALHKRPDGSHMTVSAGDFPAKA
ncbi:HNH endonuclease [Devosia ginsengisoli]|uniref:HNH endonuclease n=1 Tax=Devosia ginsengisoli TaxID=400770 RepID=UPI0026ED4309|nr:HNH endonuclease [Devosia ginsengisoli]MCR6673587.1 HNH endonuclease [Devosia ginsengisoli]